MTSTAEAREGDGPDGFIWVARDAAELISLASTWLAHPALHALVERFDDSTAVDRSDLRSLRNWSSVNLDTRRGAERRDAPRVAWSTRQISAVLSAAGPLGVLDTRSPLLPAYDLTVVLGGATTGNRLRVARVMEIADSDIEIGTLAAVTADRPLGPRELETDPDSVADKTEWRNLLRYIDEAVGPLIHETTDQGRRGRASWQDRTYVTPRRRSVRFLVAPSTDPSRRANTSDGLGFLSRRIPPIDAERIMLVTSAIYAPYQFFSVVPQLLEDRTPAHIELVGTPIAMSRGDLPLLAQRLAQEIHAGVMAATALLAL